MRNTVTALLIALIMLLTCCPALAETATLYTETASAGTIEYPAFENENLNDWLHARLGVSDALILLRDGAEITGDSSVFAFSLADGTQLLSIRFTQQGKIRFGRYGQVTNAVLLNANTGAEMPLSVLFTSVDDAQSALDLYVEEQVLPYLNTYLDASDMLPVPLDNVSLSAQGLTIHYPADRFSFFSGNSGAVEIKYYELADFLNENAALLLSGTADARGILQSAAGGCLYGMNEMPVGASLQTVLAAYGTLTEPDYTADGEIYELEAPQYRNVQLLAERGAEDDETACITGVRSSRLNLGGLMTGRSSRNECVAVLGEAQYHVTLDEAAAESYRVASGTMDGYAAGDFELRLYYDENEVLSTVEIRR